MAGSKSTLIKHVRAVGTYAEAELAEALDTMDNPETAALGDLVKKLYKNLKGVKTDNVEGRKTTKKRKPTQEEIFAAVINKIETALDKYEAWDDVDNWSMDFKVGEWYGAKTWSEIKAIHQKLVNVGLGAQKIRLLTFVERGSMYNFLKQSDQRFGRWEDVCKELEICRRTVDRYIDFYHIANAYPRLLVCEMAFETIMSLYGKLKKYLESHDELAGRLTMPLKQARISGGGVFSSRRLPGGGDDAPEELLSAGAEWSPAWEIHDELIGHGTVSDDE